MAGFCIFTTFVLDPDLYLCIRIRITGAYPEIQYLPGQGSSGAPSLQRQCPARPARGGCPPRPPGCTARTWPSPPGQEYEV